MYDNVWRSPGPNDRGQGGHFHARGCGRGESTGMSLGKTRRVPTIGFLNDPRIVGPKWTENVLLEILNTSFSMTVWLESWQCENVHQFPVIFQWAEYASVSLCIQDYEVLWGFHLSSNTIDPRLCPGRCANCWKVKSLIANLVVWEKHPRSGSEFSNSVSPTNASNIYLESHEHYSLIFFQIM